MNEVQINCPLPGGVPPTNDECDTIKTVNWTSPGITNTNFFILNTDDKLVRFRFTPISNNGSNIIVKVIYGDNGLREVKQTFNLGQLPSAVDKYHVLNLGPGVRNNQVVTFETTTTLGTSGSFTILFDCEVNIGWLDFCFIPATKNPEDLCFSCPEIFRVYWDNDPTPVGFPQAEIFFDPELQNEAYVGFYRVYNNPINPVIYFYDGNKLVKQTVCSNYIDCNETITVTHSKNDYKYSDPYIYGVPDNTELKKNLKYSVKSVVVWYPQPQYGRVRFKLTVSGGDYEDLGVFLTDANQIDNNLLSISYKYETVATYRYATRQSFIRKLYTTEFIIDAIINANGASTQAIAVLISVGQKKKYKKNNVISTTLSATCVTEVYSYVVGVHPYSPYDSAYSPKCTTQLYSFKKIEDWTVGYDQIVYMDPLFVYPAFPWYYSYGNNVYSIGLPVNREYGVKIGYQVKGSVLGEFWRWVTGEKETHKVTPITYGPQNWLSDIGTSGSFGFQVLPNCVQNFVNWGFIGAITDKSNFLKPNVYAYYLGYGLLSGEKYYCVDNPFSYWDYLEIGRYPIGGYRHSINTSPLIAPLLGVEKIDGPDWYYYPWGQGVGMFLTIGVGVITYSFFLGMLFTTIFPSLALKLTGYAAGTALADTGLLYIAKGSALCAGPQAAVCIVIIAAIIYTVILIELLKVYVTTYEPKCVDLQKAYSTNPYLNAGDTIYQRSNLTGIRTGYYSDGAYVYTQSASTISTKEKAYYHPDGIGTNRLLPVQPIPDEPTFIQNVPSLWFLYYISGVPVGSLNYFPSDATSVTFTKDFLDGDLTQQSPIDYNLPQGLFYSTISQEDANQKAEFFLNSLTANTLVQTSIQKPSVGDVVSQFTHELKIESNPTIIQLAFDNSDGLGVIVGKKLYYDNEGYFSTLNGFYSVPADDNTNYKFFYQTNAGTVVDIWTMTSSGSTSVTSQVSATTENLVQTNLDFSSSWYLKSENPDNLINLWAPDSLFTSADTWNSYSFYSNSSLMRGFIDTPSTKDILYLYDSNFNLNSYSLAQESFYQEFPLVFNQQPFPYLTGETLTLNIVQECSETLELNGIRITCFDDEGLESPAFNGVEFVVNLYLNSNSEGTNQILTYDLKIESNQYDVFQVIDTAYIGQIVDGEISTIVSQNPVQGFLYSAGTFTSCNTPTPTPTPVTWTVTPTESNTPTPTKTPTNTPTPTVTPSSGGFNCDEYYNNTSNSLTGINYTDCNGIAYAGITVNAGDGICVLEGTLNGGDSGFLINLGNCGRYYPSATPTPTTSQTPSTTPTQTITPTSDLPFAPISLSTPQVNQCNACGLTSYSVTGYTDPFDSYPTSGDTVYSNSLGTLLFNGAGQWFKTSWGSSFAQFSIRISSLGIVIGVANCGSCATNTPTPSVTPTYTPTYSETPTNTPTYPETPTNTPTYTETPTPTASGVPCYEYTATASQSDIDASDDGTVYFEYIDCSTGTTQIVTRGVADVPSNAVCARSVGSIYIIVGGNQSPVSSSSWSLPGNSC